MILSVQHVKKAFGGDVIFSDASFQIDTKEKIAIVGKNGTGKSTLLKMIVGQETRDDGDIIFGKDISFGYLAQYQDFDENGTIYDIVLSSREDLLEKERELRAMEGKMKDLSDSDLQAFLNTYEKKTKEFTDAGGETYRSEAAGVLKGLGFSDDELSKEFSMLSGGQKTRVSLGRLLMRKPDILILDEPINHLDLSSIEWLEGYLKKLDSTLILVAHDRYFMDRIVDRVLDIENGTLISYKGNYTAFTAQKKERLLAIQKAYDKQQKEIAHEENVIKKLREFNREKSIKRAESRVKKLNRIEKLSDVKEDTEKMSLSFATSKRSGKEVLSVENLKKSFGDGVTLFEDLSFMVYRDERVALIGDNGTGKTTILKIINDLVKADRGEITIGYNTDVGYYDQEQQNLNEDNTVFSEVHDAYPDMTDTEVRNVLAAFLFKEDDVFKQVKALSGGERARLSLTKLMLSGSNFLILDEPTNHLDMDSKEVLEDALLSYEGSLLFVSHDRYFINKISTRILELSGNSLTEYQGNYDYYLNRKNERTLSAPADNTVAGSSDNSDSKADWKEQKRLSAEKKKKENALKAAEEAIEDLEQKISAIEEEFNDPAVAKNSARLNELTSELNTLKEELDKQMAVWESLSEELL